eukprot:1156225-Pelagomonas_calceolata.AAC.6
MAGKNCRRSKHWLTEVTAMLSLSGQQQKQESVWAGNNCSITCSGLTHSGTGSVGAAEINNH